MIDEHEDRMESLLEEINQLGYDVKFSLELDEDAPLEDIFHLRAENDDGGWMEIHDSELYGDDEGAYIVEGDDIESKVCTEDEAIEHAQFWLTYGEHPEGAA